MDKIKINWIGFCNQSGYGSAAQDYINALLLDGSYDLRVEIIGQQVSKPAIDDSRFSMLQKLNKKKKTDDHIQVYHCVPTMQNKYKRTNRNIGFATFETYNPPDNGELSWIKALNKNDAVIVPSHFNYHVFAHTKLQSPLFYVPHAINTDIFNINVKPSKQYDRFTFLFWGTWKLRKGYPQLLEAWFSEFDSSDNVQLLIKTDHIKFAKSNVDEIKNNLGFKNKETAPILFENKIFSEAELPKFVKSVDCLVSPTLGEGFGLPGMQCMSLGVPIIITDFSGCKDYASDQTATLLKPRGFIMHECLDKYPQFRKRKWAFVAVKDIKESMRYVINNYDACLAKATVGAEYVAQQFNYEQIAKDFRAMLRVVYNV